MTRRRTARRQAITTAKRSPQAPTRASVANYAPPVAAGAGALVLLIFLAYWPAMQGGFIWDDDQYVTRNAALRTANGLAQIWIEPGAVPQYYPLTFTTLWVNYQLSGLAPGPYHVTNVVLHALAAVLFWLILRRLAFPGAWLAAAIFALHPVQVESVAWISERKNVLSGALGLGAMLAYLRFAGEGDDDARGGSDRSMYALALTLFALALLAKTVTCTIPIVIAFILWWKRGRIGVDDVRSLVPMLLLGLALGCVTIWMEQQHVGARGASWDLSFVERTLIAGRALWFYAWALVWPHDLTFIYPKWDIDTGRAWQYLFPLAAVALALGLLLGHRRIGRGPLVAVSCFAVTLAPALGFIDVYPMRYTFVADHYQYLASAALISLVVALGVHAARRVGAAGRTIGTIAGALVLVVLMSLTWRQGHIYADEGTLWRDTIAKNPGVVMARVNLGMLLHGQGRLDDAAEQFTAALQLAPTDAEIHDNLGVTLAALGDREAARSHFEEALRIAPGTPGTYNNLGNLFASGGQFAEALGHYEEAVRLAPAYADPRNNLANVLAQQGRGDEAIAQYRVALQLDPNYAAAHYNLGVMLIDRGDTREAAEHFRATLQINPGHAQAHAALAAATGAP